MNTHKWPAGRSKTLNACYTQAEVETWDQSNTVFHAKASDYFTCTTSVWDTSNTSSWSLPNVTIVAGAAASGSRSNGVDIPSATSVNRMPVAFIGSSTTLEWDIARKAGYQSVTLWTNLSGINQARGDLANSVTFNVPPLYPAAPVNGSASAPYWVAGRAGVRNATLCTDLKWSAGSGGGVVDSWYVYRWDIVSRRYELVMDYSDCGAATGWTDDSLEEDQDYGYAISAYNYTHIPQGYSSLGDAQQSPWLYNSGIYTKPAAPSGVQAVREGTGIRVTFTNNSKTADTFRVVYSIDNGSTWENAPSTVENVAKGSQGSYLLSDIDQTKQYTLGVVASVQGVSSDRAVSPSKVIIITRPAAPTGLTSGAVPSSAVLLSASPQTTVLPDGSNVSESEYRWRVKGSSTWTTVSGGTTLSWDLTGKVSSKTVIEWQCRVWGAWSGTDGPNGDGSSDWSALATVTVSGLPLSAIISPTSGTTLTSSTLTATVSGTDPDGGGITTARYQLYNATTGALLFPTVESTTALTGWTWTGIPDGMSLRLEVSHREVDGLWSRHAAATYTVAYVGPGPLDVKTSWDESTGALTWTLAAVALAEHPDAETVDVTAIIDGKRVILATGLSPTGSWSMPLAPTTTTAYTLALHSGLPSTSTQTVTVTPPPDVQKSFYVNGGPGLRWVARGRYNVEMNVTQGRKRILSYGWAQTPQPVEYIGGEMTDVRKITHGLIKDDSSMSPWQDFCKVQAYPGPLYWRDPYGALWQCSMDIPQTLLSRHDWFPDMGFTITRVAGEYAMDEALSSAITVVDDVFADLLTP